MACYLWIKSVWEELPKHLSVALGFASFCRVKDNSFLSLGHCFGHQLRGEFNCPINRNKTTLKIISTIKRSCLCWKAKRGFYRHNWKGKSRYISPAKANKESSTKEYFYISLKLNERKLSERRNTHDDFIAIPVKVIFFKINVWWEQILLTWSIIISTINSSDTRLEEIQ